MTGEPAVKAATFVPSKLGSAYVRFKRNAAISDSPQAVVMAAMRCERPRGSVTDAADARVTCRSARGGG